MKELTLDQSRKAFVILKAFHDIAHRTNKSEGIQITKDWDKNTLTISTTEGHNHFGQMNHEGDEGFSILIDELYNHFKPNTDENGR